eukprot:2056392-Pleurochrysis_carterae.AAC.2
MPRGVARSIRWYSGASTCARSHASPFTNHNLHVLLTSEVGKDPEPPISSAWARILPRATNI